MRNLAALLILALVISLSGCARRGAHALPGRGGGNFNNAGEAYTWMMEKAGRIPQWSDRDMQAIYFLQRNMDADTERWLIRDLSFAQKDQPEDALFRAYVVFQELPVDDSQLAIARAAWATYPAGSRSSLSLYIAAHGGESDLKRVADEIAADPDGWGVSLVLALRESADPAAHALLERLGHAVDPGEPGSANTRAVRIPLPHEVEDPREQALRSDDPLPSVVQP